MLAAGKSSKFFPFLDFLGRVFAAVAEDVLLFSGFGVQFWEHSLEPHFSDIFYGFGGLFVDEGAMVDDGGAFAGRHDSTRSIILRIRYW